MKHIVQQLEYGPHKIAIDYILGQLKISSVRIKKRDEQFLETAIQTLVTISLLISTLYLLLAIRQCVGCFEKQRDYQFKATYDSSMTMIADQLLK